MVDDVVRRERDLYRRVLDLNGAQELGPLLVEALALIVEVLHARLGYLELYHDGTTHGEPRWSAVHGMTPEEVAEARAVMSRGIIAEALATGQTIMTPSALLDPRFQERQSVQSGRISAVLCAPIGNDPPVGVLYLQGYEDGEPFSEWDRGTAELFARHLGPLADRLLIRSIGHADPTAPFRAALRVDGIVGRSAALAALLRQVASVAALDVSVLLTGQSGTGKTQIARVIHDNGPRASRPFVELNCGALPETLIESELFGALPGAHSTATRKIEGKVAAAEGGTLFLDEVGDLSPAAQVKLLHLLQSKEYFPLGGSKAVRADVRVIAATNVDLANAVAERRFREDLFYRLQVMPIHVPSLAQRREDVLLLAGFFLADACRRHGFGAMGLSAAARRAVEVAEWLGNVRQLAHAIEAGAIRAAGEGVTCIERRHLFADATDLDAAGGEARTYHDATRAFQSQLLREALEDADWNVAEVAQRLDLARSHVYNLIKEFGITRSAERAARLPAAP